MVFKQRLLPSVMFNIHAIITGFSPTNLVCEHICAFECSSELCRK